MQIVQAVFIYSISCWTRQGLTDRIAEHHVLYQYNLVGARDHYIGLMQTETACFRYFSPSISS